MRRANPNTGNAAPATAWPAVKLYPTGTMMASGLQLIGPGSHCLKAKLDAGADLDAPDLIPFGGVTGRADMPITYTLRPGWFE